MEKIGQNFMTAGYLVFWKQFPAAGYVDTSYFKCSNMHLNTPIEEKNKF